MIRRCAGTVLGLGVMAVLSAGCSQTPAEVRQAFLDYQTGDYARAADVLKPVVEQERKSLDENYVLNNCRYGSCALAAGDFAAAEHAFYDAYKVINSGDTNDPERQLRASVIYEGVKVWKGEPYERAMADYYLGVLYLMKHNYGNARAAFENSLFSLRESASADNPESYELVESRFALGYFGVGYANLRLGRPDMAEASFKLAEKYNGRLVGLIGELKKPGVNALIFADAGMGPRKVAQGWYNEDVAFVPRPEDVGPIPGVVALVDGRPATSTQVAYDTVDTLAMAQDRRWMDIDTIRKVKAVVGTGAIAAGAVIADQGMQRRSGELFAAGALTALVGVGLAASSQADVRYWEFLPRTVYVIPMTLTPGPHEVAVLAGGMRSAPVQMVMPAVGEGQAGEAGDAVFYFRLR